MEESLDADPQNYLIADTLTQLLMDNVRNEVWSTLVPDEMEANDGATLTLQQDGSILAGGHNPERSQYVVTSQPSIDPVTALRLEVIPDPSMKGGPVAEPTMATSTSPNSPYRFDR